MEDGSAYASRVQAESDLQVGKKSFLVPFAEIAELAIPGEVSLVCSAALSPVLPLLTRAESVARVLVSRARQVPAH